MLIAIVITESSCHLLPLPLHFRLHIIFAFSIIHIFWLDFVCSFSLIRSFFKSQSHDGFSRRRVSLLNLTNENEFNSIFGSDSVFTFAYRIRQIVSMLLFLFSNDMYTYGEKDDGNWIATHRSYFGIYIILSFECMCVGIQV